jgi:hypothetical protein
MKGFFYSLQKQDKLSVIPQNNLVGIVSHNGHKATAKILNLFNNTTLFKDYKYYNFFCKMDIIDYEYHRRRRLRW